MFRSKLFLSQRVAAALQAECREIGNLETGGLLLGHHARSNFYAVEHVPPGWLSHHSSTSFEYDEAYVHYTASRLAGIYNAPPPVIGLWHRHPGSQDNFTATDRDTHRRYLALMQRPLLSCLVNIDPDFRISAFVIHPDGHQELIPCACDNAAIPNGLMLIDTFAAARSSKSSRSHGVKRMPAAMTIDTSLPKESPKEILDLDQFTVFISSKHLSDMRELCSSRYSFDVFGHVNEKQQNINVLSIKKRPDLETIGVTDDMSDSSDRPLSILWSSTLNAPSAVHLNGNRRIARAKEYSSSESFARSGFENSGLNCCKVLICGCGSVGSLVALELARLGVSEFVLIDPDMLEPANLCRHQCGVEDLGRAKTAAVMSKLQSINPEATVECFSTIIENMDEYAISAAFDGVSVAVGCADNREADVYLSRICQRNGAHFVSIGIWEFGAAGEIFYTNSYQPNHRHYHQIFSGVGKISHLTGRETTIRRQYTSSGTPTITTTACSTDIAHVTIVGVKIITDLLLCKSATFRSRVLDSITQFTLVCNTSDPQIGGQQVEIFSYPFQITRSIEVE